MNITPKRLAARYEVSWHTAWRWLRRIQEQHPALVQKRNGTLTADLRRIRAYLPPGLRPDPVREDFERTVDQVRELQRRLDVEVRKRIELCQRIDTLERRNAAQ